MNQLEPNQNNQQLNLSIDSLDSPAPPQLRSPGKIITYVHKDHDEKMNFKKWLASLISIGNMIMSPMICYMGYQASKFGLSKVSADSALIIVGVLIFLFSLATLVATIQLRKRVLFFILYAFMVILVFLAIFTVGIFSFTPDIQRWIYENWGGIRAKVDDFNYEQFKNNLNKDIIALGVFSATIIAGILLCMFSIISLLKLPRIMKSILPPISLLVIIFSSALVMIAIFSGRSASYINLPTWMNEIAIAVGLFLVLVGFVGYYASVYKIRNLLIGYLVVLVIVLLAIIVAAIGYFELTSSLTDIVDNDWPNIYENLLKKGYNVTKTGFVDYILINFKFAGLYGMMYSFFVFLAIICTVTRLKTLEPSDE